MGAQLGSGPSYSDDDDEGSYRPVTDINITPMVDVMLVLLIIFMVAAPLMVAGVPVDLPKTSAVKLGQTQKPMVVTVTPAGTLQVRDEFIARSEIVERLRAIRAVEGDTVVYVRADKMQAYGEVMDVLGKVGEAGYGRVSLLAQPVGAPREAPSALIAVPGSAPAPTPSR
ncbi:MAG: biopolymer transporter ExbD [Verrucomicrobiae bacterium]|nr:biopolymer transporter ExbD [Verrucomicrobiae bacterium]